MVKVVSHKRLQYYDPHYAKACMTGLFGGRWKRYQQSKDDTSKWDLVWFSLLCFVFFAMCIWLHFWLAAYNSYDTLNWYMMDTTGSFFKWYDALLIASSITFTYVAFLMVLGVLHLACSQELYVHYIHKSLLAVIVVCCIAFAIIVDDIWRDGWILFSISLLCTGPFLQITAVVVMTFLSWFIAKNWMWLTGKVKRIITLSVYIAVMLCVYLAPLLIKRSPCIADLSELPSKPLVLAHRGASAIAPENTIAAFRVGAELNYLRALESDLTISVDGVPLIMHDKTLRRTTNVKDVFPDRVDDPVYMFNISDIKKLNAGQWFIDTDPHGTVSQLSEEQKTLYKNQSVPTFAEVLQIVKEYNTSFMFDLNFLKDASPDHPYYYKFMDIVVQTMKDSGVDLKKILWLNAKFYENQTMPDGVTLIEPTILSVDDLHNKNVTGINIGYAFGLKWDQVHTFTANNLSTNIYVINSEWLYSLYWCAGAPSVTTNWAHKLPNLSKPGWTMHPDVYMAIWIVTDVISAIIVVVLFLVQRVKQKGLNFSPDVVSLNAAKQRVKQVSQIRQCRNMKEKLIHKGEGLSEAEGSGSPGINGLQPDGSPAVPSRINDLNGSITLNHVTIELNNDPIPGPSSMNGDARSYRESIGDISVVSEPASEPSTPSVHSSNDIRLKEVKAQIV